MRLGFGKYRTTPIDEVPKHYLAWALQNCKGMNPTTKRAIRTILYGPQEDPPEPEPEKYTVTLRSLPNQESPAINRLRRFLKSAIRAYGFQCTDCSIVEVLRDPEPPETDDLLEGIID